MGLFDFLKSRPKKETRVNDFFDAGERKRLMETTYLAGNSGTDIRNHILNNGILDDVYFDILKSLLDVKIASALLSGKALNKDFADLYNKIKNHSSSAE